MPLSDAFAATAPKLTTQPSYLSNILPAYNAKADHVEELQQQSNTETEEAANQNTPSAIAGATAAGVVEGAKNTLLGAIGGIKSVASDAYTALTAPGPTHTTNIAGGGVNGDSVAASGFKVISDNFNNMGQSLRDAQNTLQDNHASLLDKGISVGSAGMATLNGLFSVVTAPLAAAQRVPGVGYVATAVNNLFNAIGAAGGDLGEGSVDALPVSDETKAKITPLAQQLGGLAGQILAGKVGDGVLEKAADVSHQIAQTVVDNVDTAKIANSAYPVIQAKETASGKIAARKANSDAYQEQATPAPYTPDSELPTIQAGPGEKSSLPTIQTEPSAGKPYNGEYSLEPVSQGNPSESASALTEIPEDGTPGEETTKPAPSTSGTAPSSLAKDTATKAIAKGLIDDYGDLPEYKTKSFTEQVPKIAEYVENNYEDAVKSALGKKVPPDGFVPTLVYRAVEAKAMADGDFDTINRLTSTENKLSNKVSAGAQNLGGLVGRNPDSATDLINSVKAAREGRVGTSNSPVEAKVASEVKDIKDTASKTRITKEDWSDFIDKLSCK